MSEQLVVPEGLPLCLQHVKGSPEDDFNLHVAASLLRTGLIGALHLLIDKIL